MAVAKEKSVRTLYAELNRFGQAGEYERAIKVANKILQNNPEEVKAAHCRIVSLIQVSRFEEALQAIKTSSKAAEQAFPFERAYCQYRLNKPTEALQTIESTEEQSHRLVELKAQVLYRLEQYEESVELYKKLLKSASDEYGDERRTNCTAALAGAKTAQKAFEDANDKTYEQAFNAACMLIARNRYAEAEKKLKLSEKLAREMLEDEGSTDEEIEAELCAIRTQMGYLHQVQGRLKEAQQMYAAVLKQDLDDPGVVAVANSNATAINGDQNLFDSKKKMKHTLDPALRHKLNSRQQCGILLNNCLLAYYLNQNAQCSNLCRDLVKDYPDMVSKASAIKLLLETREKGCQNTAGILAHFKNHPDGNSIYIKLLQAQFLLLQGQKKDACNVLRTLGDDMYKPGVIGTLVTLLLSLDDEAAAVKLFEDTVEWYKNNQGAEGRLSSMWSQAAQFHMRNGRPQVAADSLEELRRAEPGKKRTLAQLLMAYLQFDIERAKETANQLPSLQKLAANIDVDNLETSNWVWGAKTVKKPDSNPGTPKTDTAPLRKKRQRKRRGKLPKNYEAGTTPDAERWLPKYERTGYRKKRDRRQKEIIKGSQGMATGAADQFDFSHKDHVVADVVEKSPKQTPGSGSSGGTHRKNQPKKKKKGGK